MRLLKIRYRLRAQMPSGAQCKPGCLSKSEAAPSQQYGGFAYTPAPGPRAPNTPPRARPECARSHQKARVPQTVPSTARSGWARVACRLIDEVLAALDRGHGAGASMAVDALMALPAKVLADCRVSWGPERQIAHCIQRLEDCLAPDPADRGSRSQRKLRRTHPLPSAGPEQTRSVDPPPPCKWQCAESRQLH
jgi:hypothetical protein